jgi:hypothetical protein
MPGRSTRIAAAWLACLAVASSPTLPGAAPAPRVGGVDAQAEAEDARDLAVVADGKQKGDARAAAIRAFMARAKAGGRCVEGARALDAVILEEGFPAWLRRVGAEAIATCGDEATARYLAPLMLRGGTQERLHALRAARGHAHQAVFDAALKVLSDKEPRLSCEAAELLERHAHRPAFARLAELARKGRERVLFEPALRAATSLAKDAPEWPAWEQELIAFAADDEAWRRRAACALLLASDDARRLDLARAALADEDWSIRAQGVRWLARNPTRAAVAALVERLAKESADGRVAADIDAALARLAGFDFDTPAAWAGWWANHESTWRPPATADKPATGPKPSTPTALGTNQARASFYGVEVASARAIYIVDLSGSMAEKSKSAGSEGATRLEVAKGELLQLVDGMPAGSWFNIVGFHDTVHPWLERLAECSLDKKPRTAAPAGELSARARKHDEDLRERARTHVRRLATGGSTNIYDAFARAFADPDVDTICFLTDGTPTIGTETEAIAIREELARWNRSRLVRIHCIAVGEDNSLPKWIAADHDGEHRFLP